MWSNITMNTSKNKSKKSVKSCTATKVAKKTVKPKAKSTTTKPIKRKKALGLIPPPIKVPVVTYDGYTEYPDIADEYEYSDRSVEFDSMDEEYGVTKYYYVVNHDTAKKYVIFGKELPFSFAKIIGEEETGGEEMYIIKIASPIAWLVTNVFGVTKIDADSLIVESINAL